MKSLPLLSNHPRVRRWTAAVVASAVALGVCLASYDNVDAAIKQNRIERLNARIENVYTADYQDMADDKLEQEKSKSSATEDDMFVTEDPYGTNTTSLYVYFTTDDAVAVSYTVHADGYTDFTRDAYQESQYSKTHEFQLLGLIPGEKNTVAITLTDADGKSRTHAIEHRGASLLGNEEVQLEKTVAADSGEDLGGGLYAILGNDSDEQDFMFYYDTNGVLRGEIPVLYYRSHRLLCDDDGLMWFSASTHHMVAMNRLGKLEKIYDLGSDYILHHDYAMDSNGDIVLLATELGRDDNAVQDQVIKLSTSTGSVTRLVDFGELFADYKASTTHAGTDESDSNAKNRWDWLHCNTIQLLDDGSALFSARETSTIIKVDDLESDPTLDYMIGEPSVWAGTDEASSFLTKSGDFSDTGGQHSITYVADDSLPDGQYYMYMFDNNFGTSLTRPDFDWSVIDGISTELSSDTANSRYRKYLVNENAGTYTEVSSFDVPYSPYVSSAQELDNGQILIDSGMKGLFGQYNKDGDLLAQFKMTLNSAYIYRVYKYDFSGFYFAWHPVRRLDGAGNLNSLWEFGFPAPFRMQWVRHARTMVAMGFFDSLFSSKRPEATHDVTFTLDQAGHTYEDGNVGLEPTSLTITPESKRVAVIGLNGSGKTTLLQLLDGALSATSGSVRIDANGAAYDPSVKRDLKRIESMIGRVRREEIPNSYYKADSIREAIDEPLKKHKVPESERQAIIGNLFAHFDLAAVAREPASALDSEKRHLLAIASALSFSPAVIVADEPTKGLDEVASAHVAKALFSYDKQVVFATHDTELITRAEYAIDRTLVVDDHQVVFDGGPHEAVAFYTDLIRAKYEASKA